MGQDLRASICSDFGKCRCWTLIAHLFATPPGNFEKMIYRNVIRFLCLLLFEIGHLETPANGQAVIILTGLLEVFISKISSWQQYRYQHLKLKWMWITRLSCGELTRCRSVKNKLNQLWYSQTWYSPKEICSHSKCTERSNPVCTGELGELKCESFLLEWAAVCFRNCDS